MANAKNGSHYKTIDLTCYIANIAYLVLRLFYFILFLVNGFYVVAWVTLGTIVFYLGCFFLMKIKKYYLYALLCGNEYFAYVIITTLFLGFGTGFHFYLIGLCVISFFTSYFSRYNNIKGSILWAFLSVGIYLTLYFVTSYNGYTYQGQVAEWIERTLFTLHIVLVFVFICFYLVVFIRYALSLENKIMNESRTDELTQINNRYALYDYFAENDKSNKALALFDIDDFKKVNDLHGHVTGDYILKKVAEIASKIFSDDFVCRYGGEEFVVVLNKDTCIEKLESFRKSIESMVFDYEKEIFKITLTIGVASYSKDLNLEEWVAKADEKMYEGKKSGKNKTVC